MGTIEFTVYKTGERLSKRYALAADGKTVVKESSTQLSRGRYRVVSVPADDVPVALQQIGATIDALTYHEAIGLGVPLDGSSEGFITTKARLEAGDTGALPRDLKHFGWPELALLLLDGDERNGVYEMICGLYPAFAEVAALVRPSVSASVADPVTGAPLKTGEHVLVVIDKPERSHDCLDAIMRLAWVHGSGAAAGWLMLSTRGDALTRGPVDACVGSPERLVYEGAGKIEEGLDRLPRVSQVIGGTGMLNADDLIAFADRAAPEQQHQDRVAAAKADPAFVTKCDAVKAAYRTTYIRKGTAQRVAKGMPAVEAEKEATKSFDTVAAIGTTKKGGRIWIPLADDHVLYWPDGGTFTVADIRVEPTEFNGKECADPAEGLDYQSRNPGIIYTNFDNQIQIYSRAHGDAFAYFALLDETPWSELLARIGVFVDAGITTVAPAFSEEALALEFAVEHAAELRYTAAWGKWHRWDGVRWVEDRTRNVFDLARRICRKAAARLQKGGKDICKAKTRAAVVSLVSDDRRTAAVVEQWDADIWVLCTPGGLVDLKTGKLRPALPSDYCTMMTSVGWRRWVGRN